MKRLAIAIMLCVIASVFYGFDGRFGTGYKTGNDTFAGTKTADTVVVVGATAVDRYWVQGKGATPWVQPPGYVAKQNTLIVYCVVGDTAKARASGYNWMLAR